ncbi:MAG TPA: ABC transporter ATP-binding protein [Candidatus Alectryocaccomicrobium excrementavium]|uniref:ABC transporter ATP-binding protein n=1 Tax=Candidatus Alectryocaccomicrobium excrementavium TaxID=2840668 RepID=A0A9D1FYV3_9FIRM|nr:ABC transporter ATP-binding protein [Candidatus Alectryocaccomicrobium excrementavium]
MQENTTSNSAPKERRKARKNRSGAHSIGSNIAYLLKNIARRYPALLFMMAVEIAAGVAAPAFGIYLPKLAADLALGETAFAPARAALWMGGFALAMAAVYGARDIAGRGKYMQYNALRQDFAREVYYKSLECDFPVVERAEGQAWFARAQMTLLNGDWSCTSRMVVAIMEITTGTLSFLLYSGILSTLNPLIVVALLGLSALNALALRYARRYALARREEQAVLENRLGYVEEEARDVRAGKDIRLYGMAGWFTALRERLMDGYSQVRRDIAARDFRAALVDALLLFLRDGAAYVYLIYQATQGRIGVGDFVLYSGAIAGFGGFISSIVGQFGLLQDASERLNDVRSFLEQSNAPDPADPLPPPRGMPSIEFRDVCFSYDGEHNVLDHLSFSLAPGERLALVGVNGAGKTTIVKLLCGLYAPDSGTILLGGVDAARLRRADRFALFSAVFQDVALFPFALAENVSLQPMWETDLERVASCLSRAGMGACVQDGGLARPVSREISDDGWNFSGGEQQKLLLARALYKDAPIMVLDEPTSALDPIAESQIYEQFDQLARGKTALYISHRLASTRFCDRVLLLSGGRVREEGTHESLLRAGGEYAHMFQVQSQYYQKGAKEA